MTDGLFPSQTDTETMHGHDLTIFDKSEPRSLINIVWKDMGPIIERAEQICAEFLILPERKLKRKAKPDPIDDMLRLRFWQEYDRAQTVGGRMMQKDIIRGLCSKDYWEQVICKKPELLSWILLPMAAYITRMESSLYIALDEIEDILRLPHKNEETGAVDTKLIAEKVKIYQLLELRVKGAIVQKLAVHQRIDQRNQTIRDPIDEMPADDLQALDKAIQKVKRLTESSQNREFYVPPEREVIDIENRQIDLVKEEEDGNKEAEIISPPPVIEEESGGVEEEEEECGEAPSAEGGEVEENSREEPALPQPEPGLKLELVKCCRPGIHRMKMDDNSSCYCGYYGGKKG